MSTVLLHDTPTATTNSRGFVSARKKPSASFDTDSRTIIYRLMEKFGSTINTFEPYPSSPDLGSSGGRTQGINDGRITSPRKSQKIEVNFGAIEPSFTLKHLRRCSDHQGGATTQVIQFVSEVLGHLEIFAGNPTDVPSLQKDNWEMRLDELSTLEPGWDSYDAAPPNERSISGAREFIDFFRNEAIYPEVLNPSVVGGVGFTFRNECRSVYIEFRNTGNSHAAFLGAGMPRIDKVEPSPSGFRAFMDTTKKHLHEHNASSA